MDNNQAIVAAELLANLYRGEGSAERFPEECRPQSISDATQILAELPQRIGRPLAGWKCYFPFKAAQPSLIAPIFDVLPNGTEIPARLANLRLIEPEIVFRAERDLPPREALYTYEEVATSVVAIPAFEFMATRFSTSFGDRLGQKDPEVFADNTLSGGFVIGEPNPDWRSIDFLDMRIVTTFDGKIVSDVRGGHPVKDPFILVFVGVNLLRSGQGVKRGQILATLSPTGLLKCSPGTSIIAQFEGFGVVETTLGAE